MTEGGRRRFRPTLQASLCTLAALILLLGLGIWQLDRRTWKANLIHERETRMAAAAIDLPADLSDAEALAHRRVAVTGRFLHDHEVRLANKIHKKTVGRHILTPLRTSDGRHLIVDRGWVPMALADPETRAAGQISGDQRLSGVLRPGGWQGYALFKPANAPDEGLYNWPDLAEIARRAGLADPVITLYLLLDPQDVPGGYPLAVETPIDLPDNHLQYAITWYALALVLLVIYVVFHWHPEGNDKDKDAR